MKLSNNFSLDEFLVSAAAARLGRTINDPPAEVVASLQLLCEKVLQPLRDSRKGPVVIISGYRPKWLNSIVGGSPTSSHMFGEAADIILPGESAYDACVEILAVVKEFDQLIQEFDSWVHVSFRKENNRKEVLTARKVAGRTVYIKGLK